MMKTLYVLPLLVASGILATPEANALSLDNGRNINGRTVNGGSLNGRNMNGRNLNGRNMNGIAVHGTADKPVASKAVSVILSDGERITLK